MSETTNSETTANDKPKKRGFKQLFDSATPGTITFILSIPFVGLIAVFIVASIVNTTLATSNPGFFNADSDYVNQLQEIQYQAMNETGSYLDEENVNNSVRAEPFVRYRVITNLEGTCWVAIIPSKDHNKTEYWVSHNLSDKLIPLEEIRPENYNWCVPSISELTQNLR